MSKSLYLILFENGEWQAELPCSELVADVLFDFKEGQYTSNYTNPNDMLYKNEQSF